MDKINTRKAPKNIMLVCHRDPCQSVGGIQNHIIQLQNVLRLHDFNVQVVAADQIPGIGVDNKRAVNPYILAKLIQKIEPDLVHLHGLSSIVSVQSALLCFLMNIPYIWTPHFHPFETQKKPNLSSLFFKIFEKPLLQKSRKIFVLSDWEYKFFSDLFNNIKISKIRNGVNLQNISPPLAWEEREHILFVGRNEQNKGFDYIEQLDEWFRDNNMSVIAVTSKSKKYNSIKCTGPLSQLSLSQLYSKSKMCVVPSRYEAFSYVAIEALSYGVPVVITDQVRCSEYLLGQKSCHVLRHDSFFIDNLKLSILKFWSMNSLYAKCVINNATEVVKQFDQRLTLQEVVNEIESIL